MKKVSIGFVGLSAAASSALVQSVVDQLAQEGVVVIDRDKNGADITVLDKGEFFVLPDAKSTVENGVATIESGLSTYENELAEQFGGVQYASAGLFLHDPRLVCPKSSDADIEGIRKAFSSPDDTLVGSGSDSGAIKPRFRAGALEESKTQFTEIRDRIDGLVSQVSTLSSVVLALSEK